MAINKSILTSDALSFYSGAALKKKLSRDAISGEPTDVLTVGDFSKSDFIVDFYKKIRVGANPLGTKVYSGTLGNLNNQTVTFCSLDISDIITEGVFDYTVGFKRTSDTFIFPVTISIYLDTHRLSQIWTYLRSTGKNQIAGGVVNTGAKTYLIIAPFATYESTDIYLKYNTPVTTSQYAYNPESTVYTII